MSRKTSRANLERKCVHKLYNVLRDHDQVISISEDVRPGCSSILRHEWDRISRESRLKLQPQIDLLFEARTIKSPFEKIMCGVEVKYFKKQNNKFNWPFYAGIDEAIATLNYGLDRSALWQVFSPSTSKNDLDRYGASFWVHLRKLGIPIEFTMLVDNGSDFDVYRLRRTDSGYESDLTLKLSEIPLVFPYKNPIMNEPLQIELRKLVVDWWKLKTTDG